jgi:hypothetical protein
MEIDKIITLASSEVRLQFLAMERSLRATGNDLPLWVIPYNENRFDLPPNAQWWELKEITEWLKSYKAHPMMRKYQCLTIANYQFVDSDVIFLRDPAEVLRGVNGFVPSCGHWHNPGHTYTHQSLKILKQKSSSWQKLVFNAGQFACDQAIYSIEKLKETAASEAFISTCLELPFHDQPGMNLLVNTSGIGINNLTLPPFNMESTWAGDYKEPDYRINWNAQNQPYLIHWAGCSITGERMIDELFFNLLYKDELNEWNKNSQSRKGEGKSITEYFKKLRRKLRRILEVVVE